MDDDDDFPFDLASMFSPSRPKVDTADSESDDDFDVPAVVTQHAGPSVAAVAVAATSSNPPAPSTAQVEGPCAHKGSSSVEGTAVVFDSIGVHHFCCWSCFNHICSGLRKYLKI